MPDVEEPIELLWREPGAGTPPRLRGGALPRELAARYEGGLGIPLRADRPTVVSNFVTTLDGVAAMRTDGTSGGGDVSGRFEPDRFLMALLRSLADVIIVGAGTFTADPHHEWTPRRVHPRSAEATAALRTDLGLARQPTTIVVTGRGDLDPAHPGLTAPDVPAIVVTTEGGAEELRRRGLPDSVRIEVEPRQPEVSAAFLVGVAGAAGAGLAVCEGGPHLYADLLAAGLVDEAFQTLSPQLAGRDEATPRRSLVDGLSLGDRSGSWARLVSVHRAGSHLFLRYALAR